MPICETVRSILIDGADIGESFHALLGPADRGRTAPHVDSFIHLTPRRN